MRISSLQIFNIANDSLAKANQAMVNTQEQLSTGKRVNRPSDDPVAATKIMSLSSELSTITQFKKNIDIANNNLTLEETTLNGVNNIIHRIEEVAVQAGNTATLTTNEYRSLASEVDARLDELQNLLNSRNANGDYVFGGYKSTVPPFQGSADRGFNYFGDEGQHLIKVASNTTVAASDSGKAIFVDVASESNTVKTYASPANQSNPPVQISVGRVVDHSVYDDFYPEDMIITFNADGNISPPGKNYTVTERSTGRTIVANEPYLAGNEIEANGVTFRVSGTPTSGNPATAATKVFGADTALTLPVDFSAPNQETFNITVAGRTETIVLDSLITSTTDLANTLNSSVNGNAGKFSALGVTVDNTGIRVASGINFRISGGSANIDTALGLNTAAGTTSTDGERQTPGDRLFVDSSNKQDILTTLVRFSEAMKNFDGSSESRNELESVVANTIGNLGNAQTSVLEVKAKIGARINTLESTTSLHLDSELVTQRVLSALQDTDYAEAATRLSSQSLILQAAQSSFIRVSQLSLVNQL